MKILKTLLLFLIIILAGVFLLKILFPHILKPKSDGLKSPQPTAKVMPSKKPNVNKEQLNGFCGVSTFGSCYYDIDCYSGGCSSEICQSKSEQPVASTCVYLECHKKPANVTCGCLKNECQWRIVR